MASSRSRRGGGGGLRIVAGELGGRRLRSPPDASGVRPSAERSREAIFSMLGPIRGPALDLFCGSGALGLEALSRGAEPVTLVDTDPKTAAANVAALGVGERATVVGADAVRFLASAGTLYDLVLCDPPYRLAAALGPELDKLLPDRLRPGARVVVECSPADPLELALPLLRERRHGAALLRIHEVEERP